ncbi:hypothetical protein G6F35_014063 [Rhizopus arrhizus]|nr:hypothetical protein G6F35_014063 [Rhizopus arrhizus]
MSAPDTPMAAEDGGLVQRQRARLDPVGHQHLDGGVVGGQHADPATTGYQQRRKRDPQSAGQAQRQQAGGQQRSGHGDQPARAQGGLHAAHEGAAQDCADPQRAQHVAVQQGAAFLLLVGQQRQQRPQGAGRQAEGERAQHDDARHGGMLGVAQRGDHAFEEAFGRQATLGQVALPAPDRPDQPAIAEAVQQEDPGRAHGAQQQAADGGADGAGDVVVDAVEQDGAADVGARDLFADGGLPGGAGRRTPGW